MNTRILAPATALLLAAAPLAAQAPKPAESATGAAGSITASDVARRIGILAHDSMGGRDTPSRGLELAAQYVADQFKSFGLQPGGENGTWFQRYPITRRRLDPAASQVVLRAGSVTATAPLTRSARFVSGVPPKGPVQGSAILVGGAVSPEAVAGMKLRDKVVIYVHDYSKPIPGNATQVARAIRWASRRRSSASRTPMPPPSRPGSRPVRRSATAWSCGSSRRRWSKCMKARSRRP